MKFSKYSSICFFACVFLLINGCTKDEPVNEVINTDVSVSSIVDRIIYNNQSDLDMKLDHVLSYNYGNALENELDISREFNSSFTRVVVSINFKSEFTSKYNDQNPSNNNVVIDIEESIELSFEGDDQTTDFNLGSSPWITCNITFSFFNHTPDLSIQEQEDAFLQAGEVWTNQIPGMEFINLGNNNDNAIFRIDFSENINHPPCPKNFTSSNTIAHAFWPVDQNWPFEYGGDVHFNDSFTYTNGQAAVTQTDFISVAVHEIGHSLGIAHNSQISNSIMFPSYSNGSIKRVLAQDDIDAINELYFNNCSGNAFSTISLSGNLDFGDVQINTNSSLQTLTVTNTGNQSFNVTEITSSNNTFTIINPQSIVLESNEEFDFNIRFNPSQVQSYNGIITIENDADGGDSTISVIGTGVDNTNNSSLISLSGTLDFGSVDIGTSATDTFTISNTGNQSFNVSSISFPGSVYISDWNSGVINAGGSQTVTVTFQPINEQSYNGTVTVNSDADNNNGNNTISISGSGFENNIGQPNLVYNDFRIDGDDNNNEIVEAGEDIDLDIRLKNIGNALATNIEVIITTNDSDINFTDNDATYDDILEDDLEWNSGAFDFNVSADSPSKTVVFNIQINSNEGTWTDNFSIDIVGDSGGLPEVYAEFSPRDSCSATGSSDDYRLDLNTIYYRNGWNIDGIIGYGSDDYRGMWYRFRTTSAGQYIIGLDMNGDSAFQLYDSCTSSSPIASVDNNSNDEAEGAAISLNSNTDYYIRFYNKTDPSVINFAIAIQNQ